MRILLDNRPRPARRAPRPTTIAGRHCHAGSTSPLRGPRQARAAARASGPGAPRVPRDRDEPRGRHRDGARGLRAQLRARRASRQRYPDPDIVVARQALQVQARQHADPAPVHRHAVGRGPGLERRRPLSPVERHSRTTRACAGSRRTATSPAASAIRRATPTATPSTTRAGRSPASTARARSCATSTTARSTVLADKFEGKELNAPNDAVVHPNDGSIWFTDPGYGSLMEYEGNRLPQKRQQRRSRSRRRRSIASTPRRGDHQGGRRAVQAERALLLARLPQAATSPTPASRTTRTRRASSGSTTSTATQLKNPQDLRQHGARRQDRLRRRHPLRRGRQRLGRRGLGRRRLRRRARLRAGRRRASARSGCRRSAPTSASAAPSATGCS